MVLLLMTTAFAGCLSEDENGDKEVIRLAFTVKDDYEDPDTNPQLMADYIAAHSGYDVEIYPISSSNAAIEAVRLDTQMRHSSMVVPDLWLGNPTLLKRF